MSIRFTCQCGKHFKVRDEFAGRRMLCPVCESPLGVPTLAPTHRGTQVGLKSTVAATPPTTRSVATVASPYGAPPVSVRELVVPDAETSGIRLRNPPKWTRYFPRRRLRWS